MKKTKVENRTEFKLWMDWRPTIDMMTMEERGIFLTMLYDSYEYKAIQPIPEKSTVLKVAWLTMKGLVKRAIKDYDVKQGWVESTNFMDTVHKQSVDSNKTVQGQSLDSSLPTITTTTTDTSTETITSTNTKKKKNTYTKAKERGLYKDRDKLIIDPTDEELDKIDSMDSKEYLEYVEDKSYEYWVDSKQVDMYAGKELTDAERKALKKYNITKKFNEVFE